MANRLDEIRTRQAIIRENLDTLEGKDEQTEDDADRAEALLQEFDELVEEGKPLAARAARIENVRQLMRDESNRERSQGDTGDHGENFTGESLGGDEDEAQAGTQSRAVRRTAPDLMRRTNRNPFDELDSVRSRLMAPGEVRSRAAQAIEMYAKRTDHWGMGDDAAQNATNLVQRTGKEFGTAVARQVLVTGAPEYLAAFENYLSDPGGMSARAALSLTPANGGYLVPFTLDPTIILTNAGSANPYRRLANVKTTTTNNWNGVTSAGVNAVWTLEGAVATDNTPTVGTLQITPQKATAYLFGSFEVLSDSDFAQQLPELLADAKDRLEEGAFALGTGLAGQPKGLIPAGTVLASAAGNALIGPRGADVYALMAALPARFRGPRARNAWVANLNTINELRNIPSFAGSFNSIVNDNGGEPTMLGRPFVESTSVVGTFANAAKVLAFADMSQYYIVDRIGMSVVYDPIVLGAGQLPSGQGAWYAFWRVGADAAVPTAIRVLSLTT